MGRRCFPNPRVVYPSLIVENAARRYEWDGDPIAAAALRELFRMVPAEKVRQMKRRLETKALDREASLTSLDQVGRTYAETMGVEAESVERRILRARGQG